ncbi:SKA complex subunit 3 [Gouania willdenowi]|uniref:Spindle and kinetochore-associated protein 3 n=1 Tax=Gouania willdenowi TaxID=441366 RepID=A0A8C5EB28_GOUWI|nr:spindle and kinetochore-associated protein 3 [Gouania willdenowi]
MDTTSQFFIKLKKVAVSLETETTKLQQAFENRNNSEADCKSTARAMQVFHEMNSDAGTLKRQVQNELAQQKTQEREVGSFINACGVMEQRFTHNIQMLRAHWEKYGYKAPSNTEKQPSKTCEEGVDENNRVDREKEEDQDDGENRTSTSPKEQPPGNDVMRTPQLSDFGLSELRMKRAFAGMDWCVEAPPMPELILLQPSFQTPALPMIITPKCALRMDDEELQTPQMHDFGISERTVCLNNDFTMNLFQKKIRLSEDTPEPPAIKSLQTKADELDSPDPPVFCTPGLKIKKNTVHCPSLEQNSEGVQSPCCYDNIPATPKVPVFQAPYMNRLVGNEKSALHLKPEGEKFDQDSHGSKHTWKCDVPDFSVIEAEDGQIPAMPFLESALGSSLLSTNTKAQWINKHEKGSCAPACSLELDGPTKEFGLGTPRIRNTYWEPSTPEMPDLSAVTMDICKLVPQTHLKRAMSTTADKPNFTEETAPGVPHLLIVSESEFQSLPNHLRQMTLHSLNEAVHSINKFTDGHSGNVTELQMEELKRIIKVGAKAPIYVLCLAELNRLQHEGGVTNMSVVKLITHG